VIKVVIAGSNEPGNTTPGNDKPGNTTPGNDKPGNTTPGNDKPDNNTPTVNPTLDNKPSQEEIKKNQLAINAGLKVTTYAKKVKVSWGKVDGADGYKVYITYCGKKMPVKAIKTTKKTSVTFTKLLGKKIDPKKHVKVYVEAFKKGTSGDVSLCKTITAHAVGNKNKTATDAKKIKLNKSSYTLKVGSSATIKAKTVKKNAKKKLLTHTKEFRYATTDEKVAVVSSKGKITAKGKGTCIVYVYAVNGYAKKIKVTVK